MINYLELVKSHPESFKQFSCKDLLFLNYDCPVKARKVAKWSEHNFIYYVISGKKTLHTLDRSVTITAGSIAFIKKGGCIVEQFYEEPFCVVVFILPDSFLQSFIHEYAPGEKAFRDYSKSVIPIQEDFMIRSFYQSIIPYFTSQVNVPEDIIELKFKELLLCFMHSTANQELRNYLITLAEESNSQIQDVMEANYPYNLGITEYAKLTNRSVSSFKRDFQVIFNTSPGRWLIEKRIVHAKKLLMQGERTIADVAFESGFENTAHFSRMFKQRTGLTPMEYRKKSWYREAVAI